MIDAPIITRYMFPAVAGSSIKTAVHGLLQETLNGRVPGFRTLIQETLNGRVPGFRTLM